MAKTGKIDMNAANLLTVNSKAIDRAFKKAVNAALLNHKRMNNSVAIWRNGKVVVLQPNEILIDKD